MNRNKWIRQSHRWVSIAFTVTVIANIVAMALAQGKMPPDWVTYSPLLPLVLLLVTGLYLFVLPYATRWRSGRRTVECFTYQVCGAPQDGFTSAEILAGAEPIARVYELESGWHIEMQQIVKLRDAQLMDAILMARGELLHYVNRKGANQPAGLTMAGASLWLMQRDDGNGFTI